MLRASEFPQPRRRPRPRPRPGPWLALFAVGFALRCAVAFLAPTAQQPAARTPPVETIAANLAAGRGYVLGQAPTASVPPVAPWLASIARRTFGPGPLGTRLAFCAIGALIPLLITGLGGMMFGVGIGRIAGWFAACSPLLVGFAYHAALETIGAAVLVAALLLTAAWIRTPRPGRALGVGLAWGVAALAHPAWLPLVPIVAVWAWVPLGLTVQPADRTRQLLLALLGLALVVGPWTLRNAVVFRELVPVVTGGGMTRFSASQERVWFDGGRRGGALATSEVAGPAGLAELREPERDRRARERAVQFERAHGSQWPAVAVARIASLWRPLDRGDPGDPERAAGPLYPGIPRAFDPLLIESLVLVPLALWGAARTLAGERRWYQSLALLPVLHLSASAVLVYGAQRMRVTILALVALFAAAGFEDLRRRLRSRARGLRVIRGEGTIRR